MVPVGGCCAESEAATCSVNVCLVLRLSKGATVWFYNQSVSRAAIVIVSSKQGTFSAIAPQILRPKGDSEIIEAGDVTRASVTGVAIEGCRGVCIVGESASRAERNSTRIVGCMTSVAGDVICRRS